MTSIRYVPLALPEIPTGLLPADLFYPLGDGNKRKMVRVQGLGSEFEPSRLARFRRKGIFFLWVNSEEEYLFKSAENGNPSGPVELARFLIEACLRENTPLKSEATLQACHQILSRRLESADSSCKDPWRELHALLSVQRTSTHAMRVAVYSQLFAMALGSSDAGLLMELSIAALLHDIGKIRLGIPLASSPTGVAEEEDHAGFQSHPEETIRLIDRYAPEVPARARLWISQHHERFGGGGYPLGLEGYDMDDISQLLAAADLLDELASGLWDGRARGFAGAFDELEKMDQDRTFPQHFNPDLLATLLGWARNVKSEARSAAA